MAKDANKPKPGESNPNEPRSGEDTGDTISYQMNGTCSKRLDLSIEDNIIKSCSFDKGCTGNLTGISALVVGQPVDRVIDLLKGIQCRNGTSCPDQLARALMRYKDEHHTA